MKTDKKKILVAVAWPYVNGDIHLGHLAGYLLPADIFARAGRLFGHDVLMVSGSDCFGTPVALEADKRGAAPAEIVEEYHQKNVQLFKDLNLSFDLYTKTDTPIHKKVVQDLFVDLLNKEIIYKDTDQQYYDAEADRFLPDRYVEGRCPRCHFDGARSDQCDNCDSLLAQGELINPRSKLSGEAVALKESEHYFFAWQKLADFLRQYLDDKQETWHKIRPWIFHEADKWLQAGLRPRAITRDLDWGVEIPGDRLEVNQLIKDWQKKRIYVWFEAVVGYLSASQQFCAEHNLNYEDWWKNKEARHYYFMGKDNLVFHALFWPGQLHAYDEALHLPDVLSINQFLTLGGQGFSKSRGITLAPRDITDKFGLDIVRFYLALIAPENSDSDFTWADFAAKANNLIIANLGNFIFRTLKLAEGLALQKIAPDTKIVQSAADYLKQVKSELELCHFKKYAELLLELSSLGNKYLSEQTPWTLKKTDPAKANEVLATALKIVAALALAIKPLIPDTADKLAKMINWDLSVWPEDEVAALEQAGKEIKLGELAPLFARVDLESDES